MAVHCTCSTVCKTLSSGAAYTTMYTNRSEVEDVYVTRQPARCLTKTLTHVLSNQVVITMLWPCSGVHALCAIYVSRTNSVVVVKDVRLSLPKLWTLHDKGVCKKN